MGSEPGVGEMLSARERAELYATLQFDPAAVVPGGQDGLPPVRAAPCRFATP